MKLKRLLRILRHLFSTLLFYSICPCSWKSELSSEICVPPSELPSNASDSFLGNYCINIDLAELESCNKIAKKYITESRSK